MPKYTPLIPIKGFSGMNRLHYGEPSSLRIYPVCLTFILIGLD